MKLIPTDLPDVMLVEPNFFAGERGWFMESFNAAFLDLALNARGLPAAPAFVQDNHSCSRAGVLRGLHYQLPPHAQGKLVRVVKGRRGRHPPQFTALRLLGRRRVERRQSQATVDPSRLCTWFPGAGGRHALPLQDDGHLREAV